MEITSLTEKLLPHVQDIKASASQGDEDAKQTIILYNACYDRPSKYNVMVCLDYFNKWLNRRTTMIKSTKYDSGIERRGDRFLKTLAELNGQCSRSALKDFFPSGRDESDARQYCRDKGWVKYEKPDWCLTEAGRVRLAEYKRR